MALVLFFALGFAFRAAWDGLSPSQSLDPGGAFDPREEARSSSGAFCPLESVGMVPGDLEGPPTGESWLTTCGGVVAPFELCDLLWDSEASPAPLAPELALPVGPLALAVSRFPADFTLPPSMAACPADSGGRCAAEEPLPVHRGPVDLRLGPDQGGVRPPMSGTLEATQRGDLGWFPSVQGSLRPVLWLSASFGAFPGSLWILRFAFHGALTTSGDPFGVF